MFEQMLSMLGINPKEIENMAATYGARLQLIEAHIHRNTVMLEAVHKKLLPDDDLPPLVILDGTNNEVHHA